MELVQVRMNWLLLKLQVLHYYVTFLHEKTGSIHNVNDRFEY